MIVSTQITIISEWVNSPDEAVYFHDFISLCIVLWLRRYCEAQALPFLHTGGSKATVGCVNFNKLLSVRYHCENSGRFLNVTIAK